MTEISDRKNMIRTSLDWSDTKLYLQRMTYGMEHGRDIRKMISNIDTVVTELSKAEVIARKSSFYKAEELLLRVNDDIKLIEEYIIISKLMR